MDQRLHIMQELGLRITQVDDHMEGKAEIVPEMLVPGLPHLRTSMLAVWADHISGLLAATVIRPLVPVTLDLEVHLYQPAPEKGTVDCTATTLKAGRSIFATGFQFHTSEGQPIAIGTGTFMTAPDPDLRLPDFIQAGGAPEHRPLLVPVAERAGCERREPGTAVLPRSEDGLNASNTVNGGLIALVAEEAALSLTPGASVASLGLRYLRPIRIGPARATATISSGLGHIEVRDEGSDGRLATFVTARLFNG